MLLQIHTSFSRTHYKEVQLAMYSYNQIAAAV